MSSRNAHPARSVGDHLRDWRSRRRLSQLDLALETGISQKHLSFVESGRSLPSREMVLRLASRLDVPLRARNLLLHAAGYASVFPERALDAPELAAARAAIDLILKGHEPYPALAIDRAWNLSAANRAVAPLLAMVADPALLRPPVNVLRLTLDPRGLAPHIANLLEWRGHFLARLRQQIEATADPDLTALARDLSEMPVAGARAADLRRPGPSEAGILIPLTLRTPGGLLSFVSTTTVFGTPVEVTLSEIAIEAFFPADDDTARTLRRMSDAALEDGSAEAVRRSRRA